MKQCTSAFALFFLMMCSVSAQNQPVQQQPRIGSGADKLKYYEQYIGTLVQQLKNVQDQNADLEARIAQLEQKIADSQNEKREMQNAMDALRNQIKQESEVRQDQMRKLIANIEKLAAMPAVQPYVPPVKNNPSVPGHGGAVPGPSSAEYEEYIVQKGASLSAIAAAYKVSVQEIRKANNLKGDVIHPGQKLLIPVR